MLEISKPSDTSLQLFALLAIALCIRSLGAVACHASPESSFIPPGYHRSTDLIIPKGFRATVFSPGAAAQLRHIAVNTKGDLYGIIRAHGGGGMVALRDTNNDGVADITRRFEDVGGTGIDVHKGQLYFSSETQVYRTSFRTDAIIPNLPAQVVVRGFPKQGPHAAKSFTIDKDGALYVNAGAPSNACQKQTRTPGSPGLRPCPQLKWTASIWRFAASRLNQEFKRDGIQFARGVRNAVALDWNPFTRKVYLVQHGRDQLHQLFPKYYTVEQSAELPAEEFHALSQGANLGWPYTYYDHLQGKRMHAPEYGGDGKRTTTGDRYQDPLIGFPGHWAPNDLHFYRGTQFPAHYRGGAFIAFHGSWNRAPLEQKGYKVVFVPFVAGQPTEDYEVFADGFIGRESIRSPAHARFRPMGLAEGPDGALYISDSVRGRIWRVVWHEN